jgi:chemotaxis protein CheC
MNFENLQPSQLDALREISNIGIGHAATALSQLIGTQVDLFVPRVTVAHIAEVPDIIGGAETLIAGVYIQIYGDARGNILLTFPRQSVTRILGMLCPEGEPTREGILTEYAASALKEIGNILAGAYLNALGNLLNLTLITGVPAVAFDMAGAIVDYILIELGVVGDMTLVIETEFFGDPEVRGQFFVLPDPKSLEVLLAAGNLLP